jgi:imidazolonepropionase-like amidohydrolase
VATIKNLSATLAVWAVLASFPVATAQEPPTLTVITNVNILDGRGGPPVAGRVVVRGERIESVTTGDDPPPAGAAVMDGGGGYLVPGFIDMHAHLMFPRCGRDGAPPYFDRAVSQKMIATLLDFGITTVRSPATPTIAGLAMRDDLNAGRLRGPRAFAAAELINNPKLNDAQLRAVVRDALPYRPDYFKVYAALSPQAVATVIDEAHAHGIPVIGHLGRTSWLEAARLGIDHLTHAVDWSLKTLTLERQKAYASAILKYGAIHGPFHARIDWLELLDLDSAEVRDMVREVGARGIAVDPTLVAYDTKFAAPKGGRYAANAFVDVIPELHQDWINCPDGTSDWKPEDHRRWNAAYPKMQALLRMMRDAGVVLTTGTDLTNPWVIPGESLHQEFGLLVAAGFSPAEVLKMTGANAAKALKSDQVGLIEAGRRADLVLLAANPLADIGNTRSIRWVMQGGGIVSKGPKSARSAP